MNTSPATDSFGPSVDAREVAKFAALAGRWWDRRGPMAPLHAMNPARVGWIAQQARARGLAPGAAPVRLLDVGCGAGIAAEALARLGFDVTGIDAGAEMVASAAAHAPAGLALRYRTAAAEDLVAEGSQFDVVTALEVIEHVADPDGFVLTLGRLVRPGGMVVLSTLNRTAASFALAKIGAEYVARLLPVGTHRWDRFITPVELARMMRAGGLRPLGFAGLQPGLSGWRVGRTLAVNYLASAAA